MCVVPSKLSQWGELHISLLSLMTKLDTHGPTYKKKWCIKGNSLSTPKVMEFNNNLQCHILNIMVYRKGKKKTLV